MEKEKALFMSEFVTCVRSVRVCVCVWGGGGRVVSTPNLVKPKNGAKIFSS